MGYTALTRTTTGTVSSSSPGFPSRTAFRASSVSGPSSCSAMSRRKRGWTSGRNRSPGRASARFAAEAVARAACAATSPVTQLGDLLGVEAGVFRHVLLEMPERLALARGLVRRRHGLLHLLRDVRGLVLLLGSSCGAGQSGNGQAERGQTSDQKVRALRGG